MKEAQERFAIPGLLISTIFSCCCATAVHRIGRARDRQFPEV